MEIIPRDWALKKQNLLAERTQEAAPRSAHGHTSHNGPGSLWGHIARAGSQEVRGAEANAGTAFGFERCIYVLCRARELFQAIAAQTVPQQSSCNPLLLAEQPFSRAALLTALPARRCAPCKVLSANHKRLFRILSGLKMRLSTHL